MYAVRPVEYPSWSEAADEDMRLEFWAWNVLADKDLIIDPRYHRLELYGTVIFERSGGYPGVVIYTRPMSLGRFLSYGREDMAAEGADLSVEPDEIEFKVYAGGIPLTVRSIQPVEEYTGGGRQVAYLLYVDMPEMKREKYSIFRIEAFNRAHGGERGENLYFYEWPVYENKTDTDSDPIP